MDKKELNLKALCKCGASGFYYPSLNEYYCSKHFRDLGDYETALDHIMSLRGWIVKEWLMFHMEAGISPEIVLDAWKEIGGDPLIIRMESLKDFLISEEDEKLTPAIDTLELSISQQKAAKAQKENSLKGQQEPIKEN